MHRSIGTSYGTITVGTLILQDCWVGVLFALLPLFRPQQQLQKQLSGSQRAAEVHGGRVAAAMRSLLAEPSVDPGAVSDVAINLAVTQAVCKVSDPHPACFNLF